MQNLTDLIILLDRSGSMQDGRTDHEGGLRSFVQDQRGLAGDARLTFVQFDTANPFEVVYDRALLQDVEDAKLTLVPRGGTPLLEALSRTIEHVQAALQRAGHATDPVDHPVIVMVITDGQENSSGASYSKAKVQAQVKACEAAGWKILYLGANVDEFAEAQGLGIQDVTQTLGYTVGAAGSVYSVMSANTKQARAAWTQAVDAGDTSAGALRVANTAYHFTEDQRTLANTKPSATGVNTVPPPPATNEEGDA